VVVIDYAGKVFQLAAIYLLVGPRQVVAGGHGGVLGIMLEELPLHVIDDGGGEEDAHGRL
jgi:hypothetical protein